MQKRTGWILLGAAVVGPVIGFLIACVVTYVMPKKYESEAIIEVKPLDGSSPSSAMTPQFFGTQFEMIKNHDSLGQVVDTLELVNKWSMDRETAIRILKGIVNTQNIRGTDLISIRVRHTDKEDARDITAEVARAYRNYRAGITDAVEKSRLAELNKAVKEQEEKVEERTKVLRTIPIPVDPIPVDPVPKIRFGGGPDYADAKKDLEADQALLQQMKLKQAEASVLRKSPFIGVDVHEDPQITDAPVSPNVILNLSLGAALGFILSPLMALPLIVLLTRLNPVKVGSPTVHPG
ncbi:MAG: hypothetical protein ABIT37_15190 [Luteolibacter sp.]